MQIASRYLAAALAVACLFIALAFSSATAWASDSGANSITANVASPCPATTVDIYQIASAEKDANYDTYNYNFDIAAFASLKSLYNKTSMTGSAWQKMADEGANIVNKGGVSPIKSGVATGTAATGLGDGLFLVIAKSCKDEAKGLTYSFLPAIVALPTKEPKKDAQGNIIKEGGYPVVESSADAGPWLTDASIVMKWSVEKESTKTPTKTTTTTTTTTTRGAVKTGDDTNLLPFYIAMVVSGLLLVALIVRGRRSRRE